jgi:hypothetical protein
LHGIQRWLASRHTLLDVYKNKPVANVQYEGDSSMEGLCKIMTHADCNGVTGRHIMALALRNCHTIDKENTWGPLHRQVEGTLYFAWTCVLDMHHQAVAKAIHSWPHTPPINRPRAVLLGGHGKRVEAWAWFIQAWMHFYDGIHYGMGFSPRSCIAEAIHFP